MVMIGSPKVEQHAFLYRGKRVAVLVLRLIAGDWAWFYDIDGNSPKGNDAERYASAEEAIEAGMRAALREIEGDPPATLH